MVVKRAAAVLEFPSIVTTCAGTIYNYRPTVLQGVGLEIYQVERRNIHKHLRTRGYG